MKDLFAKGRRFVQNKQLAVLFPLLIILFLAGCETTRPHSQRQYRWGIYERHLFDDYEKPGHRSPLDAALVLEADVAKTIEAGERVPPGVHAHLGYLHYLSGNVEAARQHLNAEKELFPVSTVFVDTLLDNLGTTGQRVE